jgi:hypothetical protein
MALSLMGDWGSTVPMDELHELPNPEPMGPRHCPMSHVESFQIVQQAMNINNLDPINCVARVSEDSKRMLLSFDIASINSSIPKFQTEEIKLTGIIINYQNQAGRWTYGDGEHTFACTNEMISTEYKVQHKSTANLRNNVRNMVWDRCEHFEETFEKMTGRNDFLKSVRVSPEVASHHIIEAGKRGVINWREIPKVVDYWENPEHNQFEPRNLYSLSNSFSSFFQDKNPFNVADRSTRLVKMMEDISYEMQKDEWETSEEWRTDEEQKVEDDINGFSGP